VKKAIIAIIILLVLAGLAAGAYFVFWDRDEDQNASNNGTQQVAQDDEALVSDESATLGPITSIQQALDRLADHGLVPENQDVVFYQMIGADDGVRVEIDGIRVELYIFNNGGPVLDEFMAGIMSVDDFVEINGVHVVVHDSQELLEAIRIALQ